MPGTRFPIPGALAVLCGLVASQPVAAQVPLGIRTASGLTISPVYEGWYENPDGTFSLSFGYYNRNFEEIVELPHGAANRLEPAVFDGAQPTRFHPRRHWGVFTVTVPADFGDQAVVWTIDFRGERTSIPGRLHLDWRIDALDGEAETGNTPPVLAFAEDGPKGAGPGGTWGNPVEAAVDTSLPLTVWAWDDGRSRGSVVRAGRTGVPVTLTWFKHLGPGDVTFDENTATVPIEGGKATTLATFAEPGDYVIRVRANDGSGVSTAGHSQCCWTNGFVRVRVTR
ncbi:MAG: hypothetical protein OXI83_16115 [Gemmatimonadota bacterium]|nr:hypothetical protein [Gemmatimonadota bacterium]